jgi:hypothetical protein
LQVCVSCAYMLALIKTRGIAKVKAARFMTAHCNAINCREICLPQVIQSSGIRYGRSVPTTMRRSIAFREAHAYTALVMPLYLIGRLALGMVPVVALGGSLFWSGIRGTKWLVPTEQS